VIDLDGAVPGPTKGQRLRDYRAVGVMMMWFMGAWTQEVPGKVLARVFAELRERRLEYLESEEFAVVFNELGKET
jgi:hypothetical protein